MLNNGPCISKATGLLFLTETEHISTSHAHDRRECCRKISSALRYCCNSTLRDMPRSSRGMATSISMVVLSDFAPCPSLPPQWLLVLLYTYLYAVSVHADGAQIEGECAVRFVVVDCLLSFAWSGCMPHSDV